MRSSVARRIKSCLVAGGIGLRPCFSKFARTNLSILVLGHLGSFTAGAAGAESGSIDQNCLRSGVITYLALAFAKAMVGAAFGHTAPAFTQAARSATSESFNFPPRGICKSGLV